jgi:hypothetical protein
MTFSGEQLAELCALRDDLASRYSDLQVLQAEVALAKAKLDSRRRKILISLGVSPLSEVDEVTGEILPPKSKE